MKSLTRKGYVIAILGIVALALIMYTLFPGPHTAVFSKSSAALHLSVVLDGIAKRAEKYAKKSGSFNGFSQIEHGATTELHGVDFRYIGNTGYIVVANHKYGVIIILEPSLNNENILWKCSGYPSEVVDEGCKSLTQSMQFSK